MTPAEYVARAYEFNAIIGNATPPPLDASVQIGADIRIPSTDPTFETCADAARRQLASTWVKRGALGMPQETVSEAIRRLPGSDRDEQVVTIDWKPVDG
jgi:hypothetical protein